jgi:DNA-binding transcriptional LysR family regulator
MATYPEVQVRLTLADRQVALVEEGIDIAICVRDLDDSSYIARRLTAVRMIVCAAPTYLRSHAGPRQPGDLTAHNCLIFAEAPAHNHADWPFEVDGKLQVIRVSGDLVCNMGDALKNVAVQGRGIVRLPSYIVDDAIAAGKLEELLDGYERTLRPVHAVYPHRDHVPGKVRTFVEFSRRAFALRETGG